MTSKAKIDKVEKEVERLTGTQPGQEPEYFEFDYNQDGHPVRFKLPPADAKFWRDVVLVYGPKAEPETEPETERKD
jgi:hypothetical protein